MNVKELIKQLKMAQKNHEWKEIQVKIWTIEKWEVKEKDLILQNIVESNYDWKTTIILTNY
jgi:hypothetical protein